MGEDSAAARYVSEFLGTFVLVFTIGCNVLSGQPVWGGVSIACALMVMIYALGASSGANFNPAVSLGLAIAKKLSWSEMAIYWACQMAGGIAGGFCYFGMFVDAFKLGPTKGHGWFEACLCEVLYTFMLVFVVLNVAASKKDGGGKNSYYGLAIGFVIVAGAYSGGAVSMGCFNPAVAFGIEIPALTLAAGLKYGIIYTAFEFIGAVLAVALFWVVRPEERSEEEEPPAEYGMASKLVSEFLGTYILVLTVGLNVLSKSTAGALSIAASLMCMIYALGSVSGANFNPAVTTAILIRGGLKAADAGMYIAVQIVAGLCAAFTYAAIKGTTFALKPEPWYAALLGEFVFTFVLAFVVLSVATTDPPLKELFGFAIGMCVTLGGNAVGKISGGSLNPAVSIGIATSHIINGGDFWVCIPYSIVECAAGAIAAATFMLTHPSQMKEKGTTDETTPLTEGTKKEP